DYDYGNCQDADVHAVYDTGTGYSAQYYDALNAANCATVLCACGTCDPACGTATIPTPCGCDYATANQKYQVAATANENVNRYITTYLHDGLANVTPAVQNIHNRVDVPFNEIAALWSGAYECSNYGTAAACGAAPACLWNAQQGCTNN